ncbi:MAG: 3-methyl-2-oxobutanoate hydroxymethyltransferase [Phycisphaeraceae bacterium]|nr:3-methyl-2-oxobutanoate hydroxymethyltransferase [Phycisphaeraceae bacterium]
MTQRSSSDRTATSSAHSAERAEVSLRSLQRQAREGGRFACLTCYDATTARWLERAGVEVLLVGDTAAEVVLGFPSTIHAPLELMIALTAAVKRGAPRCVVMADMPFMSYQPSEAEAIRNAGRFMTEGSADLVKLEVDGAHAGLVAALSRAGVPVVAHIGSRPQRAKLRGGYAAEGRTASAAAALLDDARLLEAAGATMLLIEACPEEVSAEIVRRATIPVIGCGAGASCHGQVVVLHDLLGLTDWQPAFARPLVDLGSAVESAAAKWRERVRSGALGEHPIRMPPEEAARFAALRGTQA